MTERRVRAVLVAAGLAVLLFGAVGLATDAMGPHPAKYLGFALAGLVGHDALLVPVALVVGAVAGRVVAPRWWGLLRGGLFASAAVLLVALPLVTGGGRTTTNPSALPRNYPVGLVVTLVAVWVGTAAIGAVRVVRSRRGGMDADERGTTGVESQPADSPPTAG